MDEDIAEQSGEDGDGAAEGRLRRLRPAPRRAAIEGSTSIALIIASPDGQWRVASDSSGPAYALCGDGNEYFVGMVLTKFRLARTDEASDHSALMRTDELRRGRADRVVGFVEYPALDAARIAHPVEVSRESSIDFLRLQLGICTFENEQYPDGKRGNEFVEEWRLAARRRSLELGVLRIRPALAIRIVSGAFGLCHLVGFGSRLSRRRLLAGAGAPTKEGLKGFRRHQGVENIVRAPARPRLHKITVFMHDAHVLLDWLDATKDIKDLERSFTVATKFAKIFARHRGCPVAEVLGETRKVSGATLRRRRVHLDAVACLCFRRLWCDVPDGVHIYLYLDSSPQWHGQELMATSFELWDPAGRVPYRRELMPVLSLQREFLDAVGKTASLLWQIFLVVGPQPSEVARFCSMVRGMCTDMGTERLIANIQCFLKDFYEVIGCRQRGIREGPYQFDMCVQSPGWMHGWDIVLRRGLSSLSWFPQWLESFKCVVKFFRLSTMVSQMCKHLLVEMQLPVIAEMIRDTSVPSIAEWRWGTLYKAVKAVKTILLSLSAHFEPDLFKNAADPVTMKRCAQALRSPHWISCFEFVFWYCYWICSIQSWGGGCACHSADDTAVCKFKGRRLEEAETFVEGELERGLIEANGWSEQHFFGQAGTLADLLQLQVCVRGAVHLARMRFDYLGKLPWLIARILHPGVRERCIEQFESAPADRHHRVTLHFLLPGSPLRQAIDQLTPACDNAAQFLRDELQAMTALPMDDSVAEAPHASANRIQKHGRCTKFPTLAASMRLDRNIENVRTICQATDMKIADCFLRRQSLLQPPKRVHRNKKISYGNFCKRFYEMSHMLHPRRAGDFVDDGPGDLPPGPDDAPPAGEVLDGEDEVLADADDPAEARPRALAEKLAKEEKGMMREWFRCCMTKGKMISLPLITEDSELPYFLQVLRADPCVKSADVFKDSFFEVPELAIAMQPLDRWGGIAMDPAALGNEAEVFVFLEPTTVDVLRDFASRCEDRHKFQEWQVRQSDVEGCMNLHTPQALRPPLGLRLHDISMPTLCLLDALRDGGWRGRAQLVEHTPGAEAVFDERFPMSKKYYLRCVLAVDALWTAGVLSFRSGRSNAYYSYLYKFKREPPADKSAKEWAKAVNDAADIGEPLPALAVEPVARLPLVVDPDIASQSDRDDGDEAGAPPPAPRIAPPPAPPIAPALVDADIAGESGDEGPVAEGVRWPDMIEGARVSMLPGRDDESHFYHARLAVICPRHGPTCNRSRSVELCKEEFGVRAPLFYLCTWLARAGEMSVERHKAWRPNARQMRDYAAEHDEDFL